MIGDGDEDDIYTWVTSLPDSVLGPVPDGATRSESFYSFEKFGYMKNLPAGRRKKKGVYYRSMGFCDFKVSWLLIKLGRPFIYDGMQEFAELIGEFIEDNPRYLK